MTSVEIEQKASTQQIICVSSIFHYYFGDEFKNEKFIYFYSLIYRFKSCSFIFIISIIIIIILYQI